MAMEWKLFDKNGNQVNEGDEIVDFREDRYTLKAMYPPGTSGGMSGKLQVRDSKGHERLLFPHVFKCKFVEVSNVQEHADAPVIDDLEAPKSSPRYQRAMAREKGYDE